MHVGLEGKNQVHKYWAGVLCLLAAFFVGASEAATVTLNESWRSNGTDAWSYSDNQAAGDILGTADSIYLNVDTNAFNTPPIEFTISSSAGAFNLDSITVRPFNDANDFQFEIYPTGGVLKALVSTLR